MGKEETSFSLGGGLRLNGATLSPPVSHLTSNPLLQSKAPVSQGSLSAQEKLDVSTGPSAETPSHCS